VVVTPPHLYNASYSLLGLNNYYNPDEGESPAYSTYSIGFMYNNDINGVANAEAGATLRLQAQFQFNGVNGHYFDLDITQALSGINGYSGSVQRITYIRFEGASNVVFTFTLTDGSGLISNALQLNIPAPEGAN
jgi:hypothetical protein